MVLKDHDFHIAFRVNDFVQKKPYEDEKMFKWIVKISEGGGDNYYGEEQYVKIHKCSDDDWSKFYKPKKDKEKMVTKLQESNSMYCMNKHDLQWKGKPLGLFGAKDYVQHRRIEIRLLPYCELKNETVD